MKVGEFIGPWQSTQYIEHAEPVKHEVLFESATSGLVVAGPIKDELELIMHLRFNHVSRTLNGMWGYNKHFDNGSSYTQAQGSLMLGEVMQHGANLNFAGLWVGILNTTPYAPIQTGNWILERI